MQDAETLFHGSKWEFDAFSLEQAGRLTGATNGALGIWVTPFRDLASRFMASRAEGYLYTLDTPPGDAYDMPLRQLDQMDEHVCDLSDDEAVAYYDAFRRDLMSRGISRIRIIEQAGQCDMQVLLDPETIVIRDVEHHCPEPADDGPSP